MFRRAAWRRQDAYATWLRAVISELKENSRRLSLAISDDKAESRVRLFLFVARKIVNRDFLNGDLKPDPRERLRGWHTLSP